MIYDEIIVGSGPCAYAYILGKLNQKCDSHPRKKIALITSSAIRSNELKGHPKLFDGTYKYVDNGNGVPFGRTASLGGLSVAWGGVLIYPVDEYRLNYKAESISQAAEALLSSLAKVFSVYIKQSGGWQPYQSSQADIDGKIFVLSSRNTYGWENGGTNIYSQLERYTKELGVETIFDTVKTIHDDNQEALVSIYTETGQLFNTKKLVLGAGGLGNVALLSDYLASDINIHDHTPLKIYSFKVFGSAKETFPNSSTPLHDVIRYDSSVISIYRLSGLSDEFINKTQSRFRYLMWCVLPLVKKVYLGQCWTKSTYACLQPKFSTSTVKPLKISDVLSLTWALVRSGHFPFYYQRTRPGEGFHYMRPASSLTDIDGPSVLACLEGKEKIVLLGGVCFNRLQPNHPSFSFMVDAFLKGYGDEHIKSQGTHI